MINHLLEFSIRQRLMMVVAVVVVLIAGLNAFSELPIDAVPDITNNQVQINTPAPGLAPPEVEKLVTYPIETAIRGLPDVTQVRSLSNPGLSQVTVVFKDQVGIYFARQLLSERLAEVQSALPANVGSPVMGPNSTGLGEIYQYVLSSTVETPGALRTLQEYLVKPQIRSVAGVADVNVNGGYEQQFQVEMNSQKMISLGVTLEQLTAALKDNNLNAGGGTIQQSDQQLLVRGIGLVRNVDDIRNTVVASHNGIPTLVSDVARVVEGPGMRQGAATYDGHEAILGIVMMLKGENARTVSHAVDNRIKQIRAELPAGVTLTTVYDRTTLVDQTVDTVVTNLVEGGVLVIAVLLLLLRNIRGALIVACVIPLSMFIAVIGMNQLGISANLLSLGALDFGMIVDGSVVLVDNAVRRLAESRVNIGRTLTRREVAHTVLTSAQEVGTPLTFGVVIIIAVYLPIMTLHGIEGKMFRPMAYTVSIALAAALLLSLTVIPAICTFILSRNTRETDNRFMLQCERRYLPILNWAIGHRAIIAGGSVFLFIGSALLIPLLGSVFTPQLDEGSLEITATRLPGSSVPYSVGRVEAMETSVLTFPEVKTVFTHIGTSEIATDPDPPNISDSIVMLKDRSQWPRGMTKDKLVQAIQNQLNTNVPGQAYSFSQPIQMHTGELISGTKSDVAIKIFGEDTKTLTRIGAAIQSVLIKITGAQDVSVQQTDGLPTLDITVDRIAAARYGISVVDVQNAISTCIGGAPLGQVIDGDKRFDIVLKLPESQRNNIAEIRSLPVAGPNGAAIPLSALSEIAIRTSPAQIDREQGQRVLTVQANVRGRDLGSFVASAESQISQNVQLPSGYRIEFGGEYQNILSARARLSVVVPMVLAFVFLLLYQAFKSLRQAAIIFSCVPLSVTGGVLALFLRGMPFSITAGIGFIALFGISVLNGVVLVSAINTLRDKGADIPAAVRTAALSRLRPVMMTALVASLGFVPMAVSDAVGAEVQRPLATVVIGGILSSTLLTLLVLPTLYSWFEREAPNSVAREDVEPMQEPSVP